MRDVLEGTEARGVDILVNTLSGDLALESLHCVAEGGSILDLQKHDGVNLGSRGLENKSYYHLDIVGQLRRNPVLAQR